MAKTDPERKPVSTVELLTGGAVALVCGLDRIAMMQLMISRPIVAAPLVGWFLGSPMIGLQIGLLVELLWVARLPVGAVVPPDDTQAGIGSTVLTCSLGPALGAEGTTLMLLCLLIALPLGKAGQFFDHFARQCNVRLLARVDAFIEKGCFVRAELQHLKGLLSFALAAAGTYCAIVIGGAFLVPLLWPLLSPALSTSTGWLILALPLIGVAVILGTINVSRTFTLYCASFCMAFLLLWLV